MNDGKIGIKILCEGLEEYKYIKKLLGFPGIFSDIYYFDEPINCKGITKIFPRYQDLFSKNLYEVILVFCDADKNSKDFQELCSKIDNCMFGGNKVSEHIVVFSNPVTLQIVLSHFADVKLSSSSKAKNEKVVEELTGLKDYRGHEEQIDFILKFVKSSNVIDMRSRVSTLSSDLNTVPSTNFFKFLENISSDNVGWINSIRELTGEAKSKRKENE